MYYYTCPLSFYDCSPTKQSFPGWEFGNFWVPGFTPVCKDKNTGFSTENRVVWGLRWGYIWGLGFEVYSGRSFLYSSVRLVTWPCSRLVTTVFLRRLFLLLPTYLRLPSNRPRQSLLRS